NEIAAASLIGRGDVVNPQQQRRHVWPPVPAVARAYLDQLVRAVTLAGARADAIRAALDRAEAPLGQRTRHPDAAAELEAMAASLPRPAAGQGGATRRRLTALAATLHEIADALR